jgi:hypothetical protein
MERAKEDSLPRFLAETDSQERGQLMKEAEDMAQAQGRDQVAQPPESLGFPPSGDEGV